MIKVYARAAAVANNIGEIAVEHHHTGDASNAFNLYKIAYDIINRVVGKAGKLA